MKRLTIVLAALVMAATNASAQLSIEAETGIGFILNEDTQYLSDAGWDISKLSIPSYIGVGYKLPTTFDIPSLGESTIIVGGKLGLLTGTKASGSSLSEINGDFNYSWNTIPVYAFGRAEAGRFFTEVGLGFHAWTWKFDADTGNSLADAMLNISDNGLDLSAYVKTGLLFNLSEKSKLSTGINIHSLGFDNENTDDNNILTIGLFVGLSYSL